MIEEGNNLPTVKLTACVACKRELFESHKFCRWCGADQFNLNAGLRGRDRGAWELSTNPLTIELPAFETAPALTGITHRHSRFPVTGEVVSGSLRATGALTGAKLYHRVSGPLVKAITASLATGAPDRLHNPFFRKLVLALISVPVWVMLVLLSPLDAYLASKALLSQSESSTF